MQPLMLIALLLYLLSLFLPAFSLQHPNGSNGERLVGLAVLESGWISVLDSGFFSWFCNIFIYEFCSCFVNCSKPLKSASRLHAIGSFAFVCLSTEVFFHRFTTDFEAGRA